MTPTGKWIVRRRIPPGASVEEVGNLASAMVQIFAAMWLPKITDGRDYHVSAHPLSFMEAEEGSWVTGEWDCVLLKPSQCEVGEFVGLPAIPINPSLPVTPGMTVQWGPYTWALEFLSSSPAFWRRVT